MSARRRTLPALVAGALVAACSTDNTGPGGLLAATYAAEIFQVTPVGGAMIDVFTAGGTLTISIKRDGTTTGSLFVPASVTGGAPFTASMEGTVTATGLTASFHQDADTFVRDLTWSRFGTSLVVTDQVVAGTAYTITLAPQ